MRALLGMLIKRRIAGAGPASGRKKGAHAGVASPAHPAACFKHAAACLAPLQACKTAKPRRWACRDPGSNRGLSDLQSDALPAELSRLVGKEGGELPLVAGRSPQRGPATPDLLAQGPGERSRGRRRSEGCGGGWQERLTAPVATMARRGARPARSSIWRLCWARPPGQATPVGFEPTRGDPIGLAGRRLSRSAKVS